MSAQQLMLGAGLGPDSVALTSDDWYTPRWLFDAAGLVFDVDVCAPVDPQFRTCPAREYLTVIEDGLAQPWHGVVWLNPPYSGSRRWVQRWTEHPDGLALVIAAQGTRGGSMLDLLLRAADGLALLSGGVEFIRPGAGYTSLNFALALAARGNECRSALERVARHWSTPAWRPVDNPASEGQTSPTDEDLSSPVEHGHSLGDGHPFHTLADWKLNTHGHPGLR